MILYHAITVYQLECCILHKIKYHQNEVAHIMLLNGLPIEQINNLKKTNMFKEVYIIHYKDGGVHINYEKCDNPQIFNRLHNYDEIYLCGYHYGVGIELAKKQIPFSIFEEACGVLCKSDRLENIVKNISNTWFNEASKYGLLNNTYSYIKKIYCNIKNQDEIMNDDRIVDFDINKILAELNSDELKCIFKIFNVPEVINVAKNTVLILTQHYANLGIMTWEQQKNIYRYVIDYFLEGYNLLFKPHPYDLMYYTELFPDSIVIRERFPSELLPYVFERRPECIASINSTSVKCIKECFNKILEFDIEFEKQFENIHRYYVAFEMIKQLIKEDTVVYMCGVNKSIIYNFATLAGISIEKFRECESINDISEMCKNSIFILDDLDMFSLYREVASKIEKLYLNNVCIFLNSSETGLSFVTDNTDTSKIMVMEIEGFDNRTKEISFKEYIYTYSRKVWPNMNKIEKNLEYSNIIVSSKQIDNNDRENHILKGILNATEKRLLHYISREDELEKKLRTYNDKHKKIVGVIPARWESSRFPGKPLALINGKPMIWWVYNQALKVDMLDRVVVATDDKRIQDVCVQYGMDVVMTLKEHRTGAERVAEVAEKIQADLYLNIQGDEPLIEPNAIQQIIDEMLNGSVYYVGLKSKIKDEVELQDKNVVKAITDIEGYAMYFSRVAIPNNLDIRNVYRVMGLYGYTRDFLLKFRKWGQSSLEIAENGVEMLRAMEHGYKVKLIDTQYISIGVDNPEDIERVEKIINEFS